MDKARLNFKAAGDAYQAAGRAKDQDTADKLKEQGDALTEKANEFMDGTGGGAPSPTSSSSGSLSGSEMINKSRGK